MKKKSTYTHPTAVTTAIFPQQILCESSSGWVEMGGYGSNTGGGFIQE
jgi:hypothetical protein